MSQLNIPSKIRTAYDIPTTVNSKPPGYGIKIAIINCYHYSNMQSDLNTFCLKYSLNPISLNIINQAGNKTNNNYSLLICSIVQIINIITPGATVYVVEARSNSQTDILTAVETAINLGINIICMPFGMKESAKQSSNEYLFLKSGIAFIASSGDNNIVSYPASSQNVLAVGGSTLILNNDNTRQSEVAWSASGSGISSYVLKPSYQNNINNGNYRNTPDVSLAANLGINTYCSILGGYYSCTGTTISCALMTGIVAICNQLRKNKSKPLLNTMVSSTLCIQTYIYNTIYNSSHLYGKCMYDIHSGSSGIYNAGVGYDIASGLGSINVNDFCQQLSDL